MKSRLLNKYEEITYDALNEVCASVGARVFPKVRIADIFPLERSGVSSSHYSYGLRAHFDFLITNSTYDPLFSVEFDGPLHKTSSTQQNRDRLKNELCDEFNHGLLRINSNYLNKKYRGLDLLTYFVEAWFLETAFQEAQSQGLVPYDEDFDICFIAHDGKRKDKTFPYWLSLDIQLAIQKLHKQKIIGQMVPSHYVGTDRDGNYRCLSWLLLDQDRVIRVVTGMRAQRFPAVCKSELVSMLAMFDIYERLQSTLAGKNDFGVSRKSFIENELPKFQGKYEMASAFSCSPSI
jgi:hypothetical protein